MHEGRGHLWKKQEETKAKAARGSEGVRNKEDRKNIEGRKRNADAPVLIKDVRERSTDAAVFYPNWCSVYSC